MQLARVRRLRVRLDRTAVLLAVILGALAFFVVVWLARWQASDPSLGIDLFPVERRAVVRTGEVLAPVELQLRYTSGRVVLSGDPAPLAPFAVDDHMLVEVTRPDGTIAQMEQTFTSDCWVDEPVSPEDVTDLFLPGVNRVVVTVSDVCGWQVGPVGIVRISGVTDAEVLPSVGRRADPTSSGAVLTLIGATVLIL